MLALVGQDFPYLRLTATSKFKKRVRQSFAKGPGSNENMIQEIKMTSAGHLVNLESSSYVDRASAIWTISLRDEDGMGKDRIEIMKVCPPHFRKLVLFCMDSYDSDSRRIFNIFRYLITRYRSDLEISAKKPSKCFVE